LKSNEDEFNANICTDYSDKKNIIKNSKVLEKDDSFVISVVDSIPLGKDNQGEDNMFL
jgi:hypothetical protein